MAAAPRNSLGHTRAGGACGAQTLQKKSGSETVMLQRLPLYPSFKADYIAALGP